jgi:uncharacterized protein (DUF697 family)
MEEKEKQAWRIVNKYMWLSMGAGLLPLPVVDMVGISALQLRMLQVLSKQYGVRFSRNLGKEIIGSLLGSVVPTSLNTTVGSAVKAVPVVGTVLGGISLPIFAGAATYAIGKVFVQHFESGGTFLDFEPAKVWGRFRWEFEKGQELASETHEDPAQEHPTTT